MGARVADVDLGTWGDNVRFWRVERGMTQVQFAERLREQLAGMGLIGSSQATISEIERGARRPVDAQRIAISRILAVPIRDLFPFPKDVR